MFKIINYNVKDLPTTKVQYVEDEKVKFERLHPANEELEFRRDAAIVEVPKIMPNSVLLERLKNKAKMKIQPVPELELHEINGAEVDHADVNAQDYKEVMFVSSVVYEKISKIKIQRFQPILNLNNYIVATLSCIFSPV
uniref:PRELI/MSF1 domain-containing protein n=1 Tax=Syphacia muris TaxID=451379 RepID=A0A0N5AKR3_9BILA